jgi:2-polyprenyl-6-methoxyphenol hydroxylase-like FAD-dependent oxidoreductase
MLRDQEVAGFTQADGSVTLHTTTGQAVTSRYLVGADGANSIIRRIMGGKLEDLGFTADWLVVDVLPKLGVKLLVDDDVMLQICDPARPTTVVSGGPGRRRWEFMALNDETLEELNCAERAWALLSPWGVTPENVALERHAVYRFRGAVADVWRQKRVFVAGDAAHLTPPFAAQGLCAGVRDAAALAWRLDVALKGQAREGLLDSYESERRVHAATWINIAIELGKVICVLDPKAAAKRDEALLAARHDPALAPPPPPPARLAGGLVEQAGVTAPLDALAGRGFVLLGRGGDPAASLTPELAAFWREIGGISVGLGVFRDVSGVFTTWLDELGADVALVRPDFYVFGAAAGAAGADALVKELMGFFARQPAPATA